MVTAAALWWQKPQNMPGTQTQSWKHQPKAQALSTEEHKHLHADCRVQAGGMTVMHHMTIKGDKANQLLSLSLELSVANHRWLPCSSPSATDSTPPPNHAYQALLHFLQDSIFFVKAWIQEIHLSFPKAFNERDTQGAWNILQVLNPAKRIKMISECKPDAQMPKTTPIKSVETEKIQRQSWTWKMIN